MTTATCIAVGETGASEPETARAGQNLRDLALELRLMLSTGTPVAIATVVTAHGPVVREAGTVLAISASGETLGFNPAGPLDQAIRDVAGRALTTGRPCLAPLEIDAEAASYIGLSGAVSLEVQAMLVPGSDSVFARALRYLDSGIATVLVLGVGPCTGYAVVGARRVIGWACWPDLPAAVIADARSMLGATGTACRSYGRHGEPGGTDFHVWMQSYLPA